MPENLGPTAVRAAGAARCGRSCFPRRTTPSFWRSTSVTATLFARAEVIAFASSSTRATTRSSRMLARSSGGASRTHSVGVQRSRKGTTTILSLYSTYLACLFPQHAAGKKHERAIVLEDWQSNILEHEPWPFLRGCIRSDGCVFVNRTGPYAYVSYDFSNRSAQIRELFMDACDLVGVEYRATRDMCGFTAVPALSSCWNTSA